MRLQAKKKEAGPAFITFPFLNEYRLFCGFTSRFSGFSRKPYDSLNLAYHVGESRYVVKRNRDLVLKEVLHLDHGYIYSARQVHGNNIIYIGNYIEHKHGDVNIEADGLMTDRKDMPVMVMGADCCLILAADTGKKAVMAVHAGWKGTLGGIVRNALDMFVRRFGSKRSNMKFFIGPGIKQCCYEIDEELAVKFIKKFGEGKYIIQGERRYFLDLAGLNREQLQLSGIPLKNIFDTGKCTCCDNSYYSYRREGRTGRQAAIALVY